MMTYRQFKAAAKRLAVELEDLSSRDNAFEMLAHALDDPRWLERVERRAKAGLKWWSRRAAREQAMLDAFMAAENARLGAWLEAFMPTLATIEMPDPPLPEGWEWLGGWERQDNAVIRKLWKRSERVSVRALYYAHGLEVVLNAGSSPPGDTDRVRAVLGAAMQRAIEDARRWEVVRAEHRIFVEG